MIGKLLCFLGFHRESYYRVFKENKLVGIVSFCKRCSKLEKVIWADKSEFLEMFGEVDSDEAVCSRS